jgi:general secretion pathway protein C
MSKAMGLDAILKRYFVVVILGLLALAAYFQASGVSQFAGSRLAVDAKAIAAPPPAGKVPPGLRRPKSTKTGAKTATAIIERNPFDSVTGPLNKVDAGVSDDSGETDEAADFSNPYGAPTCKDSVKLLIVAASEDPAWSMAALTGGDAAESKSQMRRIGDEYGAKKIWYIAWDRVWLQGGGELCQVKMFDPSDSSEKAPKVPPPVAKKSAKPRKRGPRTVPPDIASKIQKVSPSEFNVDRSVVDQIMENQAELMRSARIVPEQENGKVVGVRLFGIRPDTLLGTLGLQNGDRLETINGFNMASPEKALEAYARLRTADHLTVTVNRRGKPMNIDFNIK